MFVFIFVLPERNDKIPDKIPTKSQQNLIDIESSTGLTIAIQKVVYKGKNISTFTRRMNHQILASISERIGKD
jgi:hypothetical protein